MKKNGPRRIHAHAVAVAAVLSASACTLLRPAYVPPQPSISPLPQGVTALDQGARWDDAARAAFYTLDQGSRIMPLAWFRALRQSDGTPFAADNLARFGYLPNPASPFGLPVGFSTGNWQGSNYVGMTCAACHTRQIRVNGQEYRIDGGPALADLRGFFVELDLAVRRLDAGSPDSAAFREFAAEVLGKDAPASAVATLRQEVIAFAAPYHTLVANADLAHQSWGLGRADALGMILNRVGGLDIGTRPDHLIPCNIKPASAPVRYPFLWNASIQTKTQWPAVVPNGNDVLGLIRNLGEVYGVFGKFNPTPNGKHGIDYLDDHSLDADPNKTNSKVNSANFDGLVALEELVRRMDRPAWPGPIDMAMADEGEKLFNKLAPNQMSCAKCHGVQRRWRIPLNLTPRFQILQVNWNTPSVDVGTDRHEYDIWNRTGDTGVLAGQINLRTLKPLSGENEYLHDILTTSIGDTVLQKIFQKAFPYDKSPGHMSRAMVNSSATPPEKTDGTFVYEARVLNGIWAAAPYLHNGSVATLWDLLQVCSKRKASFVVGQDYDLKNVGLAEDNGQHGPIKSLTETKSSPADQNNGNYRCGHEGPGFGTDWTDDQKSQVIEYMKTL